MSFFTFENPCLGLFRGKNFVFDERVALTPPDQSEVEICGECDVCCKPYDDYSAGRRCQHCRVLVRNTRAQLLYERGAAKFGISNTASLFEGTTYVCINFKRIVGFGL